ncbi:MAG: hypothetical protein EA412_09190 [Chitinophagaceae bacterium]|nr:MAG: hypothetical protein EA412_09190 [Chitinophagaceae bacterium]
MYCIIDIETTGGNHSTGKITEIAVYKHDGQKIIDEFISLVNPETEIPRYISFLTGITEEMVADAPRFFEIAKQIVEITEGNIFVAHNVNYDYSFICKEFKELGYVFSREKICTVRKSRQLFPGLPSYSLGKLCSSLGISVHDRHRAAGDALATVALFEKLLKLEPKMKTQTVTSYKYFSGLESKTYYQEINHLPEKTGIYYFRNEKDEIIYIGKSKNIKKRVLTHLRLSKSERTILMQQEIHSIDYELTGSELVSLIKESGEIKRFQPRYNRARRKENYPFAIYSSVDLFGYIHFTFGKTDSAKKPIALFASKMEAGKRMLQLCEAFELCYGLCGVGDCSKSCIHFSMGNCLGAMKQKEKSESYNRRAEKLIATLEYDLPDAVLIDKGRSEEEMSCVLVENGVFKGYGYADKNYVRSIEDLRDCIQLMEENRDIKSILKHFISKNKVEKIIPLNDMTTL